MAATQSLLDAFPGKIAAQGTETYTKEAAKYWSATCELEPAAIFLPTSAEDVATAVKLLVKHDTPFAIRSGGHLPIKGAAGTNGGILISLSALNELNFVAGDTLMRAGAGARWGEMYAAAEARGRVLVGGRCPEVGVGLILGGGLSLISGTYGLACDNVHEFEVVLATGEIVVANETDHTELFWALKGGSNNFGLVTHVTLKTHPLIDGWGGMIYYMPDKANTFAAALEEFMRDGVNDPKAGIVPVWVAKTKKAPAMLLCLLFYAAPTPNPPSLKMFTDIPAFKSSLRTGSLLSIIAEHTSPGGDGMRRAFYSGSVLGRPEAVRLLVDEVFAAPEMKEFIQLANITVAQALQPLSARMLSAGAHALSADPGRAPYIWYCITAIWPSSADDERAYAALRAADAAITERAREHGVDDTFVYMNEGAGCPPQAGFETFGAEILARLQTVRKTYDPRADLHRLLAGAWKLPA